MFIAEKNIETIEYIFFICVLELPENITSFAVAHKNTSGVILKWVEPKLNDFNVDMLHYLLQCNDTVTQYQSKQMICFG